MKLVGTNAETGATTVGWCVTTTTTSTTTFEIADLWGRRRRSLNLVDLAGSERILVSGAKGDQLKEAQEINKSLSTLGDVRSRRRHCRGGGGATESDALRRSFAPSARAASTCRIATPRFVDDFTYDRLTECASDS